MRKGDTVIVRNHALSLGGSDDHAALITAIRNDGKNTVISAAVFPEHGGVQAVQDVHLVENRAAADATGWNVVAYPPEDEPTPSAPESVDHVQH